MSYCPEILFGLNPWATARPALSVTAEKICDPSANTPLGPELGSVKRTAAPAIGLWFSSCTSMIGSRAVRWRISFSAPSPSRIVISSCGEAAGVCCAQDTGHTTFITRKQSVLASVRKYGLVEGIDGPLCRRYCAEACCEAPENL